MMMSFKHQLQSRPMRVFMFRQPQPLVPVVQIVPADAIHGISDIRVLFSLYLDTIHLHTRFRSPRYSILVSAAPFFIIFIINYILAARTSKLYQSESPSSNVSAPRLNGKWERESYVPIFDCGYLTSMIFVFFPRPRSCAC